MTDGEGDFAAAAFSPPPDNLQQVDVPEIEHCMENTCSVIELFPPLLFTHLKEWGKVHSVISGVLEAMCLLPLVIPATKNHVFTLLALALLSWAHGCDKMPGS